MMRDILLTLILLFLVAILGALSGTPPLDLAEGGVLLALALLSVAAAAVSLGAIVWLASALLDKEERR